MPTSKTRCPVGSFHAAQSQSQQPSQPTQKLPAAAAALDPGAVASFVADLQARYGGGPASEALVLGGLADFLLRHFARASGVERWAAALHAAAAADEALDDCPTREPLRLPSGDLDALGGGSVPVEDVKPAKSNFTLC